MSRGVIKLPHKIKLMKWSKLDGKAWIFANGHTFRGWLILLLRGYRKHETLFGTVYKKEIMTRINK